MPMFYILTSVFVIIFCLSCSYNLFFFKIKPPNPETAMRH
uniref:Uncharacterized protein n=1 Tax=Anguilla anguilla TaxID=7936 RepID=A0A0E9WR18_ANGAN